MAAPKTTTKRVTIGRHTRDVPEPTGREQTAARLRQLSKLEAENQELRERMAQQESEARDAKHAADCETVALLNAQAAGLSKTGAARVANTVENRRRAFIRDPANRGRTFDAYQAAREAIARINGTVAPPTDTDPLDQQRPPPAPEGRAPLNKTNAEKQREADQRQREYDRSRDRREREQREREAYERRLRELGLELPALGARGRPGELGH